MLDEVVGVVVVELPRDEDLVLGVVGVAVALDVVQLERGVVSELLAFFLEGSVGGQFEQNVV